MATVIIPADKCPTKTYALLELKNTTTYPHETISILDLLSLWLKGLGQVHSK